MSGVGSFSMRCLILRRTGQCKATSGSAYSPGVPYLFRTSRGYNLLARGPSQHAEGGITPLEGLVETDWSVATFTMNWKFTRRDVAVTFEVDEPFCMVVPQPRGNLEDFEPALRPLSDDRELYEETRLWSKSRHEQQVRKFCRRARAGSQGRPTLMAEALPQGCDARGEISPEHQIDLHLLPFEDGPDSPMVGGHGG